MNEENKSSSETRILHIFPESAKPRASIIIEEIYIPEDFEPEKKHQNKLLYMFDLRRMWSNRKKLFKIDNLSRKLPRSLREHTYFKTRPRKTTCPNCLNYIETKVFYHNTCLTHAIAASLFPICMCALPYCIATFRNAAHYCPTCHIYLGIKFSSGKDIFSYCMK